MVIPTNSLEYLVGEWELKQRGLSTGDVSNIFQFSTQHAIRLCNRGLLDHHTVGRRDRRIKVEALVDFVRSKFNSSRYPLQQLLYFMEVVGLNPELYGLNGLAGRGGLRFHVQEKLYSSGEAAVLMSSTITTINRRVDNSKLEGYRLPNSKFRRVLATGVARHVRDNHITLPDNYEVAASPGIISFPDPYLGYKRDRGEWLNGVKVADDSIENQSVWYRGDNRAKEVSVRQNEDYGLYVKLAERELRNPRIDLILLGSANKTLEGGILPREEHLKRVYDLLNFGKLLLSRNPLVDEAQKKPVKDAVDQVLTRFEGLYLSGVRK